MDEGQSACHGAAVACRSVLFDFSGGTDVGLAHSERCHGWIDVDVTAADNPSLEVFRDFSYPGVARKLFINGKDLVDTCCDTKPIHLTGIKNDSQKRWSETRVVIGEAEEQGLIEEIRADRGRGLATQLRFTDAGKDLAKSIEGPFTLGKRPLAVRHKVESGPRCSVPRGDWPSYLFQREAFCQDYRSESARYLYPGNLTFLQDDGIRIENDLWSFRNCDGLFKHRVCLNANGPALIHNWHINGGRPAPRGGRMYCLAVQSVPKKYRNNLLIAGQQTVELDFPQFHPWMLYARHKGIYLRKEDGQDVYTWALDEAKRTPGLCALGELLTRDLMKPIWQIAINAPTTRKAVGAIERELREREVLAGGGQGPAGVSDTDSYRFASMLLDAIKRTNPDIELFTGIGIVLQTMDAFCAQAILTWAMDRNIEIIPIHDSFIVARQHEQRLSQAMSEVRNALYGWIRKHGFDIKPGRTDLSQHLLAALEAG